MGKIRKTDEFDRWLKDLRDSKGKANILARIERLAMGNPGDVAPVGAGVSELRIHFGPGYRVYFKQSGDITTIFYGGDKGTQDADIRKAKELANKDD
jgi:putative addiction module killer protein